MSVAELNTETTSFDSLHEPSIQKLHHIYHETEGWLPRAGKSGIRKFFLGLIQGIEDERLIKRLIVLFSAASQKDYVYTRSRCNPGLPSDTATKTLPREFSSDLIKDCMRRTLLWYRNTDEHCKKTFLLFIAKLCADTGIAHQACNLCKTLLSRRKTEIVSKQERLEKDSGIDFDTASLDSSNYSYHTDDHPQLYQLANIASDYGEITDSDLYTMEDDSRLKMMKKLKRRVVEKEESSTTSQGRDNDRICLISTSYSALSGISPCCDFIGLLPVHLSKNILGMLSRYDLSNCALVHSRWHQLVSQVRSDGFSLQIIKEEAILMQGVSAKGSNPSYAKIKKVPVPVIEEISQEFIEKEIDPQVLLIPKRDEEEQLFESVYQGLQTKLVDVEERNVYCGAYNLLVLDQRSNANRVISYAGEENLVIGFADKIVRTIDVSSGRDKKPIMQGHPASITALYMGTKKQGCVFSGSYDTTIRKWNINTGYCQLILYGHRSSVTCLDLSGDLLVSGSLDGLVKVWNSVTGNCVCTFKHSKKFSVTCVQISQNIIVSSCERGLIKVWNLKTRRIVKSLNNHGGMKVNCVRFNENFLLSGGNDDYLLLWTMAGKRSICLKAYRHPKPVLCIELKYMCAITGCADGKIRVINMLSGDCLRVLRGNSQCDPIINIFATEDRLLVNTCSNCLVMHFEPVTLEYNSPPEQTSIQLNEQVSGSIMRRPVSSTLLHSVSRAKRFSLASASDERVFKRTSSAPPSAFKSQATTGTAVQSFVTGHRPPSHYIDLQPEFRRPKSRAMMSERSASRPVSSMSRMSSAPPSRTASAASSRRRQSLRKNSEFVSRDNSPSKVWPIGNKYTPITRDNILMRVGMLSHVKKKEKHNINTEMNSISYFDRHYPKREVAATPFRMSVHTDALPNISKVSIGKFTTEEEEIKQIKSVLKEGFPEEEPPSRRTSVIVKPSLDPLRLGFSFVKKRNVTHEKDRSPGLYVDSFLNNQLGITEA